jgi:hypothetical protein
MSKQNPQTEYDARRQLDEAMAQYQAMTQQQPHQPKAPAKDYLAEIDNMVKDLDEEVIQLLTSDPEYVHINDELQKMIQEEMMRNIKWKINTNPDAITKMDKLKELISNAKRTKAEEEKKVMADINEYIRNYSDLTFEEYKQLKYGKS